MAAADEAAISSGTPASILMDRAGRAVARAVLRVGAARYGLRVAIVCGKGNNGGDGFVAARVLAREGASVRCLSVADLSGLQGAAKEQLDAWERVGRVEPFDPTVLGWADVVVDAIFGTGFKGAAEGDIATVIEAISRVEIPVVAVDIPSGVDGTTGTSRGPAVDADITVTMGAAKVGLMTGDGAARAGAVEVVDIGIPPLGEPAAYVAQTSDVAGVLPVRAPDAHKRSTGTVAVLAGSDQMTGAAALTIRGALRMGAGFANLGATETVRAVVATRSPESLTQVVTDGDVLGPDALVQFKGVLERADALAIGPGIGTGDEQRGLVERVLRGVELPVVADADALNLAAEAPEWLTERSRPLVITPHPAELARLLDGSTDDIQADRVGSARAAAERFGCIVLLKGFRSVVAEPSGRIVVVPTGGPELATAGTGDVLTGAVAALVAAGLEPFEGAWAAAFTHGVAGTIAASDRSRGGVVAWDVAESLPRAATMIRSGAPSEDDTWS
jgi:ADP-dependent NAD(P)H-hydrate dehydratase / NAD(P)H-hydrate epimerase